MRVMDEDIEYGFGKVDRALHWIEDLVKNQEIGLNK